MIYLSGAIKNTSNPIVMPTVTNYNVMCKYAKKLITECQIQNKYKLHH